MFLRFILHWNAPYISTYLPKFVTCERTQPNVMITIEIRCPMETFLVSLKVPFTYEIHYISYLRYSLYLERNRLQPLFFKSVMDVYYIVFTPNLDLMTVSWFSEHSEMFTVTNAFVYLKPY